MHYYKYLFLLSLFFFVFVTVIHAQNTSNNSDQITKKYNLTFPIAQLGNCTSIASCKAYCDDVTHKEACIAFAKQKGFYKEVPNTTTPALMQSAQLTLGCTSESSCRSFCEEQVNREKCQSFAKTHKLVPSDTNANNQELLQKAKTILGCDSQASCKTICSDPANYEKCSTFAKQTGLPGGIKRTGPGGCESEESCQTYCQSHVDECKQYGKNIQENTPRNNSEKTKEYQQEENTQSEQQRKQNRKQMINTICKNNPKLCTRMEEKKATKSGEKNREQFPQPTNQLHQLERNNPTQQPVFENSTKSMQETQTQETQQMQQYESSQTLPSVQPTLPPPQKEEIYENQFQPVLRNEWVEGASTHTTLWDKIFRFFHL